MVNAESILEINNFLDDPDFVRSNGLKQEYRSFNRREQSTGIWSGYRASIGNTLIETMIIDKIKNTLTRKIKSVSLSYHINPWISRQGFPHFDSRESDDFAGVIYLTHNSNLPNKSDDFGTTIYDYAFPNIDFHNDLDKMSIMYETNLADYNRFKNIFSEELSMFKKTLKVFKKIKFEYNKLICYPSIVLHSPDFYFGNNIENSRMTICIHGTFLGEEDSKNAD